MKTWCVSRKTRLYKQVPDTTDVKLDPKTGNPPIKSFILFQGFLFFGSEWFKLR
jgi:hypothetical protein